MEFSCHDQPSLTQNVIGLSAGPGGEYIKLCPRSSGIARVLLREYLKKREQERERNGGRLPPRLTVAVLFALFLEAVEKEKSEHASQDCQRWCQLFANEHSN